MHSTLALFALISSVFALPIDTNSGNAAVQAQASPAQVDAGANDGKVSAVGSLAARDVLLNLPDILPANVQTAINVLASAVSNICAHVDSNVGNVNVKKVTLGNGNGLGNAVKARDVGGVDLEELLGNLPRRGAADIDGDLANVNTEVNALVAIISNACVKGYVNAANANVGDVKAVNGNGVGNIVRARDDKYGLAILDIPAVVQTGFAAAIDAIVKACTDVAAKVANVQAVNNPIGNSNGSNNNVHIRDVVVDTFAAVQAAATALLNVVAKVCAGNVNLANNPIGNGNGSGNNVNVLS